MLAVAPDTEVIQADAGGQTNQEAAEGVGPLMLPAEVVQQAAPLEPAQAAAGADARRLWQPAHSTPLVVTDGHAGAIEQFVRLAGLAQFLPQMQGAGDDDGQVLALQAVELAAMRQR